MEKGGHAAAFFVVVAASVSEWNDLQADAEVGPPNRHPYVEGGPPCPPCLDRAGYESQRGIRIANVSCCFGEHCTVQQTSDCPSHYPRRRITIFTRFPVLSSC